MDRIVEKPGRHFGQRVVSPYPNLRGEWSFAASMSNWGRLMVLPVSVSQFSGCRPGLECLNGAWRGRCLWSRRPESSVENNMGSNSRSRVEVYLKVTELLRFCHVSRGARREGFVRTLWFLTAPLCSSHLSPSFTQSCVQTAIVLIIQPLTSRRVDEL